MATNRFLMFVSLRDKAGRVFFPPFFDAPGDGLLDVYPKPEAAPLQFFDDMLKVYRYQIVSKDMVRQTVSKSAPDQPAAANIVNRIRHIGSYLGMCLFLVELASLPLIVPSKDFSDLEKIQGDEGKIKAGKELEELMKQKSEALYALIDPYLRKNGDGEEDYLNRDEYDLQWMLYPIDSLPPNSVPLEDIDSASLVSFRAGVTGWP